MAEPEKPKRGRPTIPDNFLLGARNYWLYYFEEAWPEIGWHLLKIRKTGSGTIGDLQKIFERVPSKDHCNHGKAFLRGSPQPVEAEELRVNRIRNSGLRYKIQEMQSQCSGLEHSCAEAEQALREAGEQGNEIIQTELNRRRESLFQLKESLRGAESESKELDKRVLDQETYWYCAQLLDFLCGKKKYAAEPFNLANALAGLPEMGWRESFARCSKMPRSSFVRLPCRVVEVASRIWRRRPKGLEVAPIEFFRTQILKLPKKPKNEKENDGIREVLCRGWRDLRLAIEECGKAQHGEEFMPYAIASAFVQKQRQSKTAADMLLDEHDMLERS